MEHKASFSHLLGNYAGAFGNNQIVINIESILSEGQVTGYNELKGKQRPVKGSVSKKNEDFAFVLNEPGDDEWDGVFTFTISGEVATGFWQSNNGKLKRDFKLNKVRNSSEGSTPANTQSEAKKASPDASPNQCDKYLKDYEEFMNEYIAIVKKYKANPNNPTLLMDYTSMMAKAGEWTEKIEDCAANPAYAAKFSAIQMKIASAAGGI
jgi:hypothetical protein